MLSLSHIDFAYEKGPLLLQDLCMEVHDGDYVAVVGENGSGKSTLIKTHFGTARAEPRRHFQYLSSSGLCAAAL